MLSIIIPTLNEEEYLHTLLEPIANQNIGEEYEVVITDAGSQDRTVQIAEESGCKVVSGGLPAKGRNQGAKAAIGDLLLFLDPEALLPNGFLAKALAEFRMRSLDLASCALGPIEEHWMPRYIFPKFFYNLFYNWPASLLDTVYPFASSFILVKKDIHEKLGGFDEGIRIAEDHEYARRATRIGKVGFLRFGKLPLFMRRCQKEGIIKTHLKYQLCHFFNLLLGEVRYDIFNYNFGQYKVCHSGNIYESTKPTFVIQSMWTLAYYMLLILGFISWLLFLLALTPKLIRFCLKRLIFKLHRVVLIQRYSCAVQIQRIELPQQEDGYSRAESN